MEGLIPMIVLMLILIRLPAVVASDASTSPIDSNIPDNDLKEE